MSFLRSVVSQRSRFCSNTCFHSGHQQIANPIIPYVGPIISSGLKPGMALYIQGVVPDYANQFSINFQTGQNKYDDIAFHFNPWIGQFINLNSFENGNWALKECVPDQSFIKGETFNILIVIKTDGYEVYVNDIKQCTFQHRISLYEVTTLGICGDVCIDFFGSCENWRRSCFTDQAFTSTDGSFSKILQFPSGVSHRVIQPVLPHVGKIRDGLKPEMAVFFQGALPAHPKEFEINFQTGQSTNDDIAFHFNPRIGNAVYLNSLRNGNWEKEEHVSDHLFTKNAAFYMFVVIHSDGYEVYVNGLHLCRFNNRISLDKVSTISIYGDVTISVYGFIDNWSRSFTFTDFLNITGIGSVSSLPEVSYPVILPALPFVGTIRGGIKPDMGIFFQGSLPAHGKSFTITFQTGRSDSDDIAFHFNPRFYQNVHMNSFRNGSWELEETVPDKFFTKGASFNMFIIITSEGYKVHVNGVQLCIFKHRIPLGNISTLGICGDVSITIYGFIDNWSRSSLCMDQSGYRSLFSKNISIPSEVSHPVIQPALPYMGSIKDKIQPDTAVLFHGAVSENGKSFEINFLTGDSYYDDIAFHISPRIGQSVAINSFKNGSWMTEESTSKNPFRQGTTFQLFFVIKSEGYEVYVNNLQHCTFKHRIPLESVYTLGIRGDVTISYFGFIEKWSDSFICKQMNKIQEILVTSGSLIDFQSKLSPEVPHVEELKTNTNVTFQASLPACTKDSVNLSIHHETDKVSKSTTVVEVNKIEEMTVTSVNLIDVPSEISTAISKPELPHVAVIPEEIKTDTSVIPQVTLSADTNDTVNLNIHHETENVSVSSMVLEMNKIEEMTVASVNLIDVPSEISPVIIKPELQHVAVIEEEIKTDTSVISQVTLSADINDVVNLSIRHETEKVSESTIVVEMKEIQDTIVTSVNVIDVPSEISPAIIKPELPHVAVIPEEIKTDTSVISQVTLSTDTNDAVNLNIHHETEKVSVSSVVVEMNKIEEMTVTSVNVIDVASEISPAISKPELQHVAVIPEEIKTDTSVISQVTLSADTNDVVNLNIHHETEKVSESTIVLEMKEIHDMTVTSVNVIDVPSEISPVISKPESQHVAVIEEELKTDTSVISQVTFSADINDVVTLNIHHETEKVSESTIVVEMKEIQDTIVTSVNVIDVPSEISPAIIKPELQHVAVIPEEIKTDTSVISQVTLSADTNDVVNLSIHHEKVSESTTVMEMKEIQDTIVTSVNVIDVPSEISPAIIKPKVSESTIVMEMKEIQDTIVTSVNVIDVLSEISPAIIKPELPHVAVIPEELKTDTSVISQVILSTDTNDAVNLNIHHETEKVSVSSIVVEMKEIQEMTVTSVNLIDVPAEISPVISKPEVPYLGTIPGGLKTDMAVIFQGALPADAKQFTINLLTGENEGDDIAFHINPRIGDLVALNSFRNGSWETEEHASVMAFTKDSALNMYIVIISEGYGIYVNGLHLCTFKHRISIENVSTLRIFGDVNINYFEFIENWSRSSFALEMSSTSVTLLPITPDKLALPFVSTIPGGIKADMAILFCGTVFADSNEFEINFQTCQPSDEIAFKINPQIVRFLVLNSLRNRSSDSEELASDKGAAFNMFVVVKLEGYEVYVNGLQYCMFKHRIPSETISSLGIRGDVLVNFVGLINNWSSSAMIMEKIKVTSIERSYWRPIPVLSEVSHPVSNPVLPYVGVIEGKVKPDMAVLFQGALPADANEFTVNFQTGVSNGDDIAFHINPKLGHHVAINSFKNGSWETEESVSDKPFTMGAAFNMFVVIKSEGYEVYVNGLELCTFKHRIPLENITALAICGDVSINFIGFIETWSKFSFIIDNNEITGMRSSTWRDSSHQMIRTTSKDF